MVTKLQNKAVYITGGTGMIGLALAIKLMEQACQVTLLSRSKPKLAIKGLHWQAMDVTDMSSVESVFSNAQVDVLFHLASQTQVMQAYDDPINTFQQNIVGVWNVLDVVKRLQPKLKVLIASTLGTEKLQSLEADTLHDPYLTSKFCAEQIAKSYYDSWGIEIVIARLSNIYGPEDSNFKRLIPSAINSVLNDKAPLIESDGQSQNSFIYVEDAVIALIKLIEHIKNPSIKGKAHSVCGNKSYKVIDIINAVLKVSQREDLVPQILNHPSRTKSPAIINSQPLAKLIDWHPEIQLEEGLKRTIHWYQQQKLRH